MQAFTDLVGTTAVPEHAIDVAELTDLTPTWDIAMAAYDTADEGGEAAGGTNRGTRSSSGYVGFDDHLD